MATTTELQSFDNKGYIVEESNSASGPDPNDNIKKYSTQDGEFNNNVDTQIAKVKNMSPEEIRSEKRSIMKNVIVISFAFLLLFTAFQSMSALQSSINKVRKYAGKLVRPNLIAQFII